jgi:hypothetical protein
MATLLLDSCRYASTRPLKACTARSAAPPPVSSVEQALEQLAGLLADPLALARKRRLDLTASDDLVNCTVA